MVFVFVELPAFERHRAQYLDDDGFRALQNLLMKIPRRGTRSRTPEVFVNFASEMRDAEKANVAG
jgi:hypothetical protein